MGRIVTGVARMVAGVLGLALVVALWEGYKQFGPESGWGIGEARILPRATDLAMPHVWEMATRLLEPETSASTSSPLWLVVLQAALVSLGIACVGLLVGTVVGLGLALVMDRFRPAEHGLLPWIVLSQTVPLIAFAPMVKSWGSNIAIGAWEWPAWMSVAVIASYLAFFPVAVGALRGLQSPTVQQRELFVTYDAGHWATLRKVKLPAAVPYLLSALRLAAAAAVVGTVVAEGSIAYMDGIGRKLIGYGGQASGDPAKAWAPIFGAAVLGLLAAGVVWLIGVALRRYRRGEAT
ncbi:ABC transporter permease [Nocardioides sp. NPDC051685]|uniref:ABC transporter permease n=1 Tax=Nocardioides sp. NPDC051685 TaxID=3364334 RepID=UPI0037A568D7